MVSEKLKNIIVLFCGVTTKLFPIYFLSFFERFCSLKHWIHDTRLIEGDLQTTQCLNKYGWTGILLIDDRNIYLF